MSQPASPYEIPTDKEGTKVGRYQFSVVSFQFSVLLVGMLLAAQESFGYGCWLWLLAMAMAFLLVRDDVGFAEKPFTF